LSATNIANPTAVVTQDITYVLTATDANGCTGVDSVSVLANALGNVQAGPDTTVCAGSVVALGASGGDTYAWLPTVNLSSTTGNMTLATVSTNATYTVHATDANGCTGTAQVALHVFDPALLVVSNDTLICYGDSLTLTVTGGLHYEWTGPDVGCTDCSQLALLAYHPGTYQINAVDSNGCAANASVAVAVDNNCEAIAFPNAFTPNGDGLNDLFRPLAQSIQSASFFVYNRWGQLVFSSPDLSKGWDGTFNGVQQPIGSYAWYATATTITGEAKALQGNVSLLR
jgi:gliding motility-associated-like protein